MSIGSALLPSFVVFAALLPAGEPASGGDRLQEALLAHVRFLAGPDCAGRAAGSPGAHRAAGYVAAAFAGAGLEPLGDALEHGRSFVQRFQLDEITGGGPGIRAALLDQRGRVLWKLVVERDFVPLPLGLRPRRADAPIVFAGYGIRARELAYDDLAGVDLAGRWALILRGWPAMGSRWSAPARARHAGLLARIQACQRRGAAGLIIASWPPGPAVRLPAGTGIALDVATVPILALSPEAAARICAAGGLDLGARLAAIARDLRPASQPLAGLRLAGATDPRWRRLDLGNVLARLPGSDPDCRGQALVLAAHLDHLGRRRAGDVDVLLPGADDDASGVAVLLEVARHLAALPPERRPRRSLIFAAFDAEEIGCLGSARYCRRPAVALDDTAGAIMLDMVGHAGQGLAVAGCWSAAGLHGLADRALGGAGWDPYYALGFAGASDHRSFLRHGVPALLLTSFVGYQSHYHRRSDTWERLDLEGMRHLVAPVAGLLHAWADLPRTPSFRPPDHGLAEEIADLLALGILPTCERWSSLILAGKR